MKNSKSKKDEHLPGYPHYDKTEDIYENAEEIESDPENINNPNPEKVKITNDTIDDDDLMESPVPDNIHDDEEETPQNEDNITAEDLHILNNMDDDVTDEEDEWQRKNRVYPIDITGEDLDVPGAEDDDINEEIGEEDEENNLYSLPDQE